MELQRASEEDAGNAPLRQQTEQRTVDLLQACPIILRPPTIHQMVVASKLCPSDPDGTDPYIWIYMEFR